MARYNLKDLTYEGDDGSVAHFANQEDLAFCLLGDALEKVLSLKYIKNTIAPDHIKETPDRVTRMFQEEFFSGCKVDPASVLQKRFKDKAYDEMVYVNNIGFVSFCAHHLVPFMGKVHFAYIPNKQIVGLSKIPRLVEILSKRPQVQEKLAEEIVDVFMKEVKPQGCGVVIEAYHLCMAIRGIKKENAYTKTTALRSNFRLPLTKDEFLHGVPSGNGGKIWP